MSNYIDLTGQRFGNLVVKEIFDSGGSHKAARWTCVCDCGNEKIVDSQMLRRGYITHCGCEIKNRLVGQKFGKLTVLENTGEHQGGHVVWLCRCDCGNLTKVITSNLNPNRQNRTLSCGCHRKELATKHGLYQTKIYKALNRIRQRCFNTSDAKYKDYGGRGITVCDEWMGTNGYVNFYNWSIHNGYKEGLTIDRIDNNGNYCPDNCRWTTRIVQQNNRRVNHNIEINGETHTLTEWSRIKGISATGILGRIRKGWSEEDAVMIPVNEKYRKGK